MRSEIDVPKTLQEAILFYSDEARCLELMVATRWADGIAVCPYCGFVGCTFMPSVSRWQCKQKGCRKQFSIKVGTYMEDSPIPLSKWLPAMWLIGNAKNGISSYEIHRALGVTQKTAWFMLHRIRLSFNDGQPTDMSGTVEADETYIGGLERNKHKSKRNAKAVGRSSAEKEIVFALLQRGTDNVSSQVRASVVKSAGRELRDKVRETVQPGSEVFTDQWVGYKGLSRTHIHEYVDHSVKYVNGRVHTNGLENFFALLKRMIKGTYVAVSPWHLQRYVEEEAFRYNERKDDDQGRFLKTVSEVRGKRLTYKQLTYPEWAFEG